MQKSSVEHTDRPLLWRYLMTFILEHNNMKYLIAILFVFAYTGVASATTIETVMTASPADQENYIRRYKKIAIREMERSGVPASIKLAQGLLESDAGKSKLARSANNHFGIKCGSQWNGEEYYKEDDDYDDRGRLIKSCFRQYRNPDASFVAHSEFLRDPAKSFRYGFLFRLDPNDYKAWAEGLRRSGYATNPNYPKLLISLIERYNLNQYDQSSVVVETPDVVLTPIEEKQRGILRTNDVAYFVNDAPISVREIARQVSVNVNRLLDYNEGLRQEAQNVSAGDRVYLQKKRKSYRGREQYHVTEEGESIYDIAQRYGLRLDKLAKRNRLRESDSPATGEKIKLRGGRVREGVRLMGEPDPNATINDVPTDTGGQIILDEPTEEPPTTTPTSPTTSPRPTYPPTTPPSQPTTTPTPAPPNVPPSPPANATQFHTVVAGETLYAISRRYGLTVDALKQLNGLTGNNISIGLELRVK